MITLRTRIQLLVFVIITLTGVAFVGARYAKLDRLFVDQSYTVVAELPDSGGVFAGAEVNYRGTAIGRIDKMVLDDEGVKLYLQIDNEWDSIPSDTLTVVANRSALGEQYLDLEPQSNSKPYLEEGSTIPVENARLPIPTVQLLTDISTTVSHVNNDSLRTVVSEMGKAFEATGDDLSRIIDTSNSFIATASENFDVTASLIRDSNTVLNGQLDSASAIRAFSKNLALFSTSLAGADPALRRLADTGSLTANDLRTFIEDNHVDLAGLLNNLVTVGDIQVAHLDGIQQILVAYPYVVEGGFSVVARDPQTGKYDAHFGMITASNPPVCHDGYQGTRTRSPQNGETWPMNVNARCTEPPTKTDARGAAQAPRPAPAYSAPVIARYDPTTGKLTWTRLAHRLVSPGSVSAQSMGEESWSWLLLQPLVATTQ